MKTVDLPPYAPTLMESTRAIGYSIEAAIADIIDNSIAASASRVDIDFFPIGESYIAILDNGWGMSSESLIAAMQYGSRNPLEIRDENDLGRYGLGMKTASLSQCRILTVLSKKSGVLTGAQWNLNQIVRNYITHPWNLNFQPAALAEYIAADESSLDFWDVAIPQDSDTSQTVEIDLIDGTTVDIHPKGRPLEWDSTSKNMLKVYGRHVRIGSGGCTKIGLSEQKIKDLREEFGSSKDSTYLHTERNPLLLIHILTNTNPEKKQTDPKQVFALGLGFPYDGNERTANYMVNIKELKNWVDIEDEDDDDDNDE